MAKKATTITSGASKSEVVSEIFRQKPDATVKEVQAELKERGVEASESLINKIKYGRGQKTSAKRRKRRSRGKARGIKTEAINGMFEKLGVDARPRDVIAALAERGMKVSSAQVSALRTKISKLRRPGRSSSEIHTVSFEHLLAAKSLVTKLGSVDVAREALDRLAKLVDA